MNSRVLIIVSVVAGITVLAQTRQSSVPLAIRYPTPSFHGTPRPIRLPNLEPGPTKAAELRVPAGTALISRGRQVTSSDPNPIIGELAYITDGDKTGTDGTVVELGPGLQWAQIDLGAPAPIQAIAMWHFHSEPRVYHDVVVQISNEPTFRSGVTTLYNNDHDDSAKLQRGKDRAYIESSYGRVLDAKGIVGRYVRLYSNGNTSDELNHYCEVEVFGLPAGD